MNKNSKIYIAGNGLVGSAILRLLQSQGYNNIITKSHSELDLTNQFQVEYFFKYYQPEYVFLCAAKVGGIQANSLYPANFILDNLLIESNVIKYSYEIGVKKLLFLGSSCIYRNDKKEPIKEEDFLTGELESTNESYAIAKIAGIKMCQSFNKQHNCQYISCMPTNLYGPNDNFDLNNSHVIPGLINKFYLAKIQNKSQVEIWGTGNPLREFLYVDDLADACLFLMDNYNSSEIINVGTGNDLTIKELAYMIKDIIGFKGDIEFDLTKPDGTYRKVLDVSKINNLGWGFKTELEDGLRLTYNWFLNNINNIRGGKC